MATTTAVEIVAALGVAQCRETLFVLDTYTTLTPRRITGLTGFSGKNVSVTLARLKRLELIELEPPRGDRTWQYGITPRGRLAVEVFRWLESELAGSSAPSRAE
jgi:hypothetical protein